MIQITGRMRAWSSCASRRVRSRMWGRRGGISLARGGRLRRDVGIGGYTTGRVTTQSGACKKGVSKGANRVDMAVTVTDKTRLALAMYTITLEARPLEQDAIKIMPAAISGSKSKTIVNKNPIKGIIVK